MFYFLFENEKQKFNAVTKKRKGKVLIFLFYKFVKRSTLVSKFRQSSKLSHSMVIYFLFSVLLNIYPLVCRLILINILQLLDREML